MESRFQNKVVFITGAANGIGRGMVEQFLLEGAQVVAMDLEEKTLEDAFGDRENVCCLTCDISDYDQVNKTVEQAVERYGTIDILMNNAGILINAGAGKHDILHCPKEDWDKVINVNVNGCFYVAQSVARVMAAHKQGVIVNTCSNVAFQTVTGTGAYQPSKAAVMKMTYMWAKELTQYGIRVNAIAPGTTMTRLSEPTRNDPVRNANFLKMMPLGRYAEVEEIVALALFLASDDASFIVGEVFRIDGGQHL